MGNNAYAVYDNSSTFFIVKNISPLNKTIRIFNYPIVMNATRDLLQIPGVSEADIRLALLKGELRIKLIVKDITIVDTNTDLLQFDPVQRNFLIANGVNKGVSTTPLDQQYTYYTDVVLVGDINGVNTLFTLPNGQHFVQKSTLKIVIYWNGVKQVLNEDYELGTYVDGYNSVIVTIPPSTGDVMTADYYVRNY